MANWAWLTDIHLDHLQDDRLIEFTEACKNVQCDGYFITGDLSNSWKLIEHLGFLEAAWQRQIIVCLGNHDFWGSSFESVRRRMNELTKFSPYVKYVSSVKYIPLNDSTCVLGHDGWYDAQNGDAKNSRFLMQDWLQIQDFANITRGAQSFDNLDKNAIIALSQKLASDSVVHVHQAIKDAVRYYDNIIILTHVPPWQEAHVHGGTRGDAMALPWYTSKMMGQLIESAAKTYENVKFTVLSGHTHGRTRVDIGKNITCYVGHADYVNPQIQRIITT